MLKCPRVFLIKGSKFSMGNLLSGFPKSIGTGKKHLSQNWSCYKLFNMYSTLVIPGQFKQSNFATKLATKSKISSYLTK